MHSSKPSRMITWALPITWLWKLGIGSYIFRLQGSGPYTSTGSQTFFKRKVNKCLQIDEIDEPNAEIKVKDDELMLFLENVYP